MVLKSEKVIKSLLKKGFSQNTTHHKFYEYYLDGKQVLYTKVSHGANHDLNKSLIGQMSRQCKLNKKDFTNLVNCPLSKEKYEEIIRKKGIEQ